MKYKLYDPDFTVEYTEQNEVIVYQEDKEVKSIVKQGIKSERQLMDTAIKLLGEIYATPQYYSVGDIANVMGLNRGSLKWIVRNQLVLNYHYIVIGKSSFLTDKGIAAVENKIEEKEAVSN